MTDMDLFAWWAVTITAGSIFHTIVSIYLYAGSRAKRRESERPTSKAASLLKNFAFVWVLLGLLVFYIITVDIGSAVIFAAGNILVEILLVVYLIKHRSKSE